VKDLGDPGRDNLYGYGLVDVAAATAPAETRTIHLVRTTDSRLNDAVTIDLPRGIYNVSIKNGGLERVIAKKLDGGIVEREKAFSYTFRKMQPQEATFELNLADSDVSLMIIPDGRSGASADITFTKVAR
jgi:hypothetical protein